MPVVPVLQIDMPWDVPVFDLATAERLLVTYALAATGGTQKDAAALLGIHPRVLNYKMKVLGMARPRAAREAAKRAHVEAQPVAAVE